MTDHEDNTTLEYSIYWLQALICQGERVSRAWNRQEGQHYPFLNARGMEEHFFLVACNKARRWLKKLRSVVENEEPIAKFLAQTENASIVRNKREHDDEYFGTGRKHDEEPSHDVPSTSPVKMNVGTSCTVYTDARLLLGGILDVGATRCAADSLQNTLRELQHAYWDKRGRGGADHFKMPERLLAQ